MKIEQLIDILEKRVITVDSEIDEWNHIYTTFDSDLFGADEVCIGGIPLSKKIELLVQEKDEILLDIDKLRSQL